MPYWSFQGGTSFVDLFFTISFCHTVISCFLQPCGHLLKKGWPIGSLVWHVYCVFVTLLRSVPDRMCIWFLIFAFFLTSSFLLFVLSLPYCYIRIYHECEGRIGKSVPRITVWHHEACRVMTNGDPEGRLFLSYSHTQNGIFSCSPPFYLK